ncbi:hypothetical protein [Luteimonas sp. TWI1416]|uniref:hypothetical protein n=1 Tax=unclassified Luteimonas TaxID=2629088 RepID=UPI00320805B2
MHSLFKCASAACIGLALTACAPPQSPVSQHDSPKKDIARIREAVTAQPSTALTSSPTLDGAAADALEVWRIPIAEVVARYAGPADAGDVKAAYIVGARVGSCHRTLREYTPQATLADYRRGIDHIDDDHPNSEVIRDNVERQLVASSDRFNECRAIPSDILAKAVPWLEQAAAAGHIGARHAYPDVAMREFDSREGIIRNPLEARRRRTLARTYLEEAVQAGNREALQRYARAQNGRGPLYPEDRRAAQVYGYVEALAMRQPRRLDPRTAAIQARVERRRVELGGRSQPDAFSTLLRDGPVRYPTDAFSDSEWEAIAAEGRRLFHASFELPPSERD